MTARDKKTGGLLKYYGRPTILAGAVLFVTLFANPTRANVRYPAHTADTGYKTLDVVAGTIVQVNPAAWSSFPRTQSNAWCGIITIEGLGLLDGDYTLVNTRGSLKERPAWVRVPPDMPTRRLSWVAEEGVWAISTGGQPPSDSGLRWLAFLPLDSELPSAYSTRWKIYDDHVATYKGVGTEVTISCPGCSAVTVSALVDELYVCNGPYRLRPAGYATEGVSVWSHAIEQECTMLHDNAGNALVIRSMHPVAAHFHVDFRDRRGSPARRPALSTGDYDSARGSWWWADLLEESNLWHAPGRDVTVECTSAGQTTRLGFDLMIKRDGNAKIRGNLSVQGGERDAGGRDGGRKKVYFLTTTNDGSVFSIAQSNIHLRMSCTEDMYTSHENHAAVGVMEAHRLDYHDGGNDRSRRLLADVTIDQEISILLPADKLITDGVLIRVDRLEGTHVIELCILQGQKADGETEKIREVRLTADDAHECLAEAMMVIEASPAETYMVQRRPSSSTIAVSPRPMSAPAVEKGRPRAVASDGGKWSSTRVVFILNFSAVDGYQLSTLHLLNHMPANIEASIMDLACESGNPPMKEALERAVGRDRVISICLLPERETWEKAKEENGTFADQLHAIVAAANDWSEVGVSRPDIARTFGELYHHLAGFDVMMMSNGGKDVDGYLLHLARLAGVRSRVVNLGPLSGGYLSPLFDAATSFVGPSHYIATNPQVNRNARGLPIKVCHPVMDVPRLLKAADSCPPFPSFAAEGGNTVRFVMVSRMATEKAPGVFVRAIAALQRRKLSSSAGTTLVIEGVMIGTGSLGVPLKRLAATLEANIRFTGLLDVDLVPCEVLRATALVLPSFAAEPLGMVAPEAMILGIPVITFGVGGTGEFVRHRENGIVVGELTSKALADALELLARDGDLRDRLGARARSDTLGVLSLADMVACHVNAFT